MLAVMTVASAMAIVIPAKAAEPFSNWTGLYVGAHAGMAWAENDFFDLVGGGTAAAFTATGIFGGGQIGYNWQSGPWVFGAEAEGSLSHLRRGVCGGFGGGFGGFGGGQFGGCGGGQFGGFGGGQFGGFGGGFGGCGGQFGGFGSGQFGCGGCFNGQFGGFGCAGQFGTGVQAIGLLSGRLGYAWDRWLLYAKGGGAIAGEQYVFNTPGALVATPTDTRFGWMIGAGVEVGLAANWSAKLEYNYVDFATEHFTFAGPGGLTFAFNQAQQVHLVKAGVNYRFGPAGLTN